MAETAAHLVDRVFPPLPVRQWVLSVPKRLRYFLVREPRAVSAVLPILPRVIEAQLRKSSAGTSTRARLGAVSFVHRFGSALNRHVYYHGGIVDGLFEPCADGQARFLHAPALTTEELAGIAEPDAAGCCVGLPVAACSMLTTPATCSAGTTAAFRLMPL